MAGRRRCSRCGQFNPKPGHGLSCKSRTSAPASKASSTASSTALPALRQKGSTAAKELSYDALSSAAQGLLARKPVSASAKPARPVIDVRRFGEENAYHGVVRAHLDRCRQVLSRPSEGQPFDVDRAAAAIQQASARVHQFDSSRHPGAADVYSERTRALAATVATREWSSSAGEGIPDYFAYDKVRGGWFYLKDDVRGFLASADADLRARLPH